MQTVVGPKGQVVIKKEIRDQLGVQPGALAIQRLAGDHVEIYFVPPRHRRSLRGALAGQARRSVPVGAWEEARQEAWRQAVALAESDSPDDAGGA